jgi:hypothetical protein
MRLASRRRPHLGIDGETSIRDQAVEVRTLIERFDACTVKNPERAFGRGTDGREA